MMHSGLGVHLSVVYAELWLDSQRTDLSPDLQQTLVHTLDYATGHIYHVVEKDASLLFTGGLFANGEALTSTFASVCTSRAVGIVKVPTFPHFALINRRKMKRKKINGVFCVSLAKFEPLANF
jgi:hypothetical protein